MQVLTLPGDQRCLYQHRSMVTCESPITSTSSEPTSNPILVPVSLSLSLSLSLTHTHTHTHTHLGAKGPSSPPVIPLCPAKPRSEFGTSLGADSDLWAPS